MQCEAGHRESYVYPCQMCICMEYEVIFCMIIIMWNTLQFTKKYDLPLNAFFSLFLLYYMTWPQFPKSLKDSEMQHISDMVVVVHLHQGIHSQNVFHHVKTGFILGQKKSFQHFAVSFRRGRFLACTAFSRFRAVCIGLDLVCWVSG